MQYFRITSQNTKNVLKLEQLYQPKVLNTVKILLLAVTIVFIFYKLLFAYHLPEQFSKVDIVWSNSKFLLLFFVILLMFLNWTIEASKWKLLINKYEHISFVNSLKAVVTGIALSIITPNQIGDFVGRIVHLKTFNKIKGTLVTVIGHTAQVIMTIAFGLFAFIWLFNFLGKIDNQLSVILYTVSVILIVISVFLFMNIQLIGKIPSSVKIHSYLQVFENYTKNELFKVLGFSFFRYLIFVLQYYLLLEFYNVNLQPVEAFCCIIATLCAQSFVPSFLLIELGMRGASALFFFTIFTHQAPNILLSAYTLWIINLMIPSFYGLYSIILLRIKK